MIKDYCKATISWQPKVNSGYGTTYDTAVSVANVYIEPNSALIRGQDDTTTADAVFILYEEKAFKKGDKVTMDGQSYTISRVDRFFKVRSTSLDHIEVSLKEVQNG